MTSTEPYQYLAQLYDKWILGDITSDLFINFYVKLTEEIDRSASIVELGIGTGRISIEISKKQKRNIIGIDNSQRMLDICLKNIKENGLSDYIQLFNMNMLDFSLEEKSQCIILPFRAIGHILLNNERQQLLKNIYHNLKNGGVFIVDHYILDEVWARDNNNKYIKMYADKDIIIYDKYDFDFSRQVLTCEVYEQKNNKPMKLVTSFEYCWISPSQMQLLLIEAGFSVKKCYGGFDFRKLQKGSEQQIWIVER